VFFVIDGAGATHVGDGSSSGTSGTSSSFHRTHPHHHEPDDEATLLAITDRPVFEAFNFYAEAEPSS